MSITTTCIDAYPKPDYIEIGNFAETERQDGGITRAFTYTHDAADQVTEELLVRATQAAIQAQLDCGLMMPGHELAPAKLKNMCVTAQAVDR